MEEIDRNDSIQKLIFCDPSDIEFKVMNEMSDTLCFLPVVDGKKIDDRYVSFKAKKVNVGGKESYCIHIDVNEELRRLGIAFKLCVALILDGYSICYLVKDTLPLSIKELWKKLGKTSGICVQVLKDEQGNKIGIEAHSEV